MNRSCRKHRAVGAPYIFTMTLSIIALVAAFNLLIVALAFAYLSAYSAGVRHGLGAGNRLEARPQQGTEGLGSGVAGAANGGRDDVAMP